MIKTIIIVIFDCKQEINDTLFEITVVKFTYKSK